MKKIISIALTAVFVMMLLTSCGTGGLDGTYIPKSEVAKKMPYGKFVFSGNKVKMYMSVMGITMPAAYEYSFSVNGNTVTLEALGIPSLTTGSLKLTYDKDKDELSLFNDETFGAGVEGAVWGKEGTFDPNAPADKKEAGSNNGNNKKETAAEKEKASSSKAFNYQPYVFSQELAEKCALYSALAYEETRIMTKSYSTAKRGLSPAIAGIAPDGSSPYGTGTFSELLANYKTLSDKDKDNIVYFTGKRDDEYVGKGNNQPLVLKAQLEYDGFIPKSIISRNYHDNNEHNISYTLAYKEVNGNEKLLAVILRGTDYVEWRGNMDIGHNSAYHESFQKADNDLQDSIVKYIKEKELSNINILITGHSRGAAVANLLAVDIIEGHSIIENVKNVYTYTFATPNNTTNIKTYNNIFNFCFLDDFVTQVPLDKKFPGWDWDKSGITYTAVADNLYKIKPEFQELEDELLHLSKSRKPSFSYKKTLNVLSAIYEIAPTVNDYNNTLLKMEPLSGGSPSFVVTELVNNGHPILAKLTSAIWDGEENKTLHDFMREYIAQAILDFDNKNYISSAIIGTGTKILPMGNDVDEIAKFFLFNMTAINDTHQALTYYNALKSNGFLTK